MSHSFTEENYLKAILKLSGTEDEAVTTNAIAERMRTKAASVTDMLKKLSAKKLIHYRKYQGVTLTEKGRKTAIAIVRKHRLWEVFLVDKLSYRWDEVHDIAEQLEHIQSETLVDRLDTFLGNPRFDPHGDPIPDKAGRFAESPGIALSALKAGDTSIMTGVVDHSTAFLRFLDNSGIALGHTIKVKEVLEYDSSLNIQVNKKTDMHISQEVAKNILVAKPRPAKK